MKSTWKNLSLICRAALWHHACFVDIHITRDRRPNYPYLKAWTCHVRWYLWSSKWQKASSDQVRCAGKWRIVSIIVLSEENPSMMVANCAIPDIYVTSTMEFADLLHGKSFLDLQSALSGRPLTRDESTTTSAYGKNHSWQEIYHGTSLLTLMTIISDLGLKHTTWIACTPTNRLANGLYKPSVPVSSTPILTEATSQSLFLR